ncbi:uncharacterized protein [Dysidea avara]|uniref:uncharacterized protein isoform X2 n=1 Tax=Dysidea avara TaxID=196820 RepID=UPI0033204650
MGNSKSSNGGGDPSLLSYSPHQENDYVPIKNEDSSPRLPPPVIRTKPRSQTVHGSSTETYEARRRTFMESLSTSSIDKGATDSLTRRIASIQPADGADNVPCDCTVRVQFDKDVKTVNVNKLFEVRCLSVDSKHNPVKGKVSYDPRQRQAEFIPANTLNPNSKYLVKVLGNGVTTTECAHSPNIANMEIKFVTGSPSPKTVRIKLTGDEKDLESEVVHITSCYDPFNSFIAWNARKWGISGEFITAVNVMDEEGQLHPIRNDYDVFRLNDNQIVYVEIKD